ncbi:NAC domain-containing protein 4-like [Euphorbia lathyris]|uniref:NAC domain-containing protein 4-like n=1 Tax=Euphorbia lathyris TaxID=212925 RepID=UPI003313AE6B
MNHHISSTLTISGSPLQPSPLVGYRFHPTDDELLTYFLKPKMLSRVDYRPPIPEIKVCDYEPWDLPALINNNSDDRVWYFFCPRDYKYLRSRRSNRTTEAGYWKPTGKPRKVLNKRKEQIGTKKSLVFYIKERRKAIRTRWIMHEYECALNATMATSGDFVLCKLKSKADEKMNEGQPDHMVIESDLENQNLNEITVNSSCDEHESSVHISSGFDDYNPKEMISEGQQVHMVFESDLENQNLKEMTVNSSCDEPESSIHISSDIDDYNPNEKLKLKANEMISESESQEVHMVLESDLENQYLNEMTVNSSCDEHESSVHISSHIYDYNPNEKFNLKADETINEGPQQQVHMIFDSDLENQNLNETTNSSCDEHISSDIDNYHPNEMTDMSIYEEGEWTCLSDFDVVTTNSANDEDKSHYYTGSDINPNEMAAMSTYQKIDISASEEGVCSPCGLTPSDSSNSTNTDNNAAEVDPLLSYINGFELEELEKLIQEDKFNSAFYKLPMTPNEISSYNSFGVQGKISEIGWDTHLFSLFT